MKRPWKISSQSLTALQPDIVIEDQFSAIATLCGRTEANASNACLIAAAPELLDQSKSLIFFYETMRPKISLLSGYPDPSGFIENLDKYIVTLKYAVAKAEGNES